jgi:lysophospholipase L1-like esterase
MKRLTLFAKGNVDVHDSLHSCRIGGELAWNGINDILRATHPGCLARLKHETFTRSDALLLCDGSTPAALRERELLLGTYPVASQFSAAIFETRADAIILSLQPDMATSLVRHKKEGFLFYPNNAAHWPVPDRAWLKSEFEPVESLDVEKSMATLAAVIERIRQNSDAPILIYNVSHVTPGEAIHCYQGFDDAYSFRIRRFNVGLMELSARTGISIIDVSSLLARHGADALKLDTIHLTPAGYRLVAGEVVRVLADLGVLDEA